jgi:hypothetical protein
VSLHRGHLKQHHVVYVYRGKQDASQINLFPEGHEWLRLRLFLVNDRHMNNGTVQLGSCTMSGAAAANSSFSSGKKRKKEEKRERLSKICGNHLHTNFQRQIGWIVLRNDSFA